MQMKWTLALAYLLCAAAPAQTPAPRALPDHLETAEQQKAINDARKCLQELQTRLRAVLHR